MKSNKKALREACKAIAGIVGEKPTKMIVHDDVAWVCFKGSIHGIEPGEDGTLSITTFRD
jgi:hypothetical protein